MKLKAAALAAIVLLVFALSACSDTRVFTVKELSVTLPSYFKESSADEYDACFRSKQALCLVLREGYELADALRDMTLADYAELVIETNDLACEPREDSGFICFEYSYTSDIDDTVYSYLVTCFKTDKAFWLVQFSCEEAYYSVYREDMLSWARTVTFTD